MKKLTEPYQVEHAQELVQTEMLEDIANMPGFCCVTCAHR